MKKVKLIYNPYSGDKSIIKKLDTIFGIYQDNDYTVVPFRITKGIKIKRAFLDVDDTYDHILIAGGDGTVDVVVNTMKKMNIDIPIAILPTGTANDFSKLIGMSSDIEVSLNKILNSSPKRIDLGKINSSHFVNIASFGMFTDVSQKIDPIFKNSLGRVSYILKGVEEAVNLKQFNISLKSDELNYKGPMHMVLIFNGVTAGNLNLAHNSKIDDGLLDVIIFKPMAIPDIIKILRSIVKGSPIDKFKDIIYFKTDELFINCEDKISTDIDGEKGPDFPIHITCDKNSVQILGIEETAMQ
ncbi:MAG: YegS/Rv2252/BmrU family lipid kinase [Clostridium sp.]|nr:YegS/Rv2252/BmrU family lipid kinase [Clostridium sp.]MBQ8998501.1 YegS/Rv2252/BmrU family lipid kinase [Clostridium sp.]